MSECVLWEGEDGCFGRNICVGCEGRLEAIREELATIAAERDRLREQNNRLIEAMLDIAHDTDDCVSPGMKHLALRALGEKP